MKHFLVLLLCAVLLLTLGDVAAVVTNVTGTLGTSVLFNANLPSGSNVQWSHKSLPVSNSSSSPQCLNQFIGRCESYQNGSLRVNNVSYNDEGMYDLSVLGLRSSIYQLRVYAPLSTPTLNSISSFPLITGSNVTLQCDAGGQNVTSYTFYRDGQKIICSGRVICRGSFLDFTPISESDSGSYTCTIQNPVSANTSDSLGLSVCVPVSNVVVTSSNSGLVWPGLDSVTLRCSARGTNVSYSWSLQGAPISGRGRYTLTDSNTALIISPVSATDNGSFICTAKNIINNVTSNDMKLNLAAPVSAVMLTSNTSAVLWAGQDSASLYCSAQGSAITFSWSLNGSQVSSKPPYSITQRDPPLSSTLTISPISKTDTGPFTCTASNMANNQTSNAVNFSINWSPDGSTLCTAELRNETLRLGCSWPGGKPAANVTMIFTDLQNTSANEVYRNVNYSSDIYGSNLTCNGNQLGRISNCMLVFESPTVPDHNNDTVTPALVGGAVNLTVDLQAGARSRATTLSTQVLPSTFSWYQGNSSSIQTGGKFRVDSTPYASTLNIDKLTEADSGEYKCVAKNFIGSSTFLFNVKVSRNGGSSNGLSGGAIAGIVIGVLAGVALIGVIVFFIFKKRIHLGKSNQPVYEDAYSQSNIYETRLPGSSSSKTPSRKEEPNYQNVMHNTSIYYNVGPGSRK
ncbi:cell adhesion molecule CEACAM5-like [Anomaloglossus baeobatrachus]|uniref:cell adhesion molecule CEACAM5-like n=1 Tax=Anomaloglossus baeobatrachus TaxID=238106 RepID=UPI003F4FF576